MSTTTTAAAADATKTSEKSAAVGSPVLLNNKIALSSSGGKPPQKVVKITTATGKVLGAAATSAAGGANTMTMGRVTTIGGKTAIKTANGQIVYLQRAPATGNTVTFTANAAVTSSAAVRTPGNSTIRLSTLSGNTNTASNASTSATATNTIRVSTVSGTTNVPNAAKTAIINTKPNSDSPTVASATAASGKTVAIQFVRSSDGRLVPLKTTAAAGTKNALTLSPTVAAQLAGKKLVTTAGSQIIFKPATPGAGATIKTVPTAIASTSAAPAASTPPIIGPPIPAKPFKIQKIMAPTAAVLAKNAASNISNVATVSTGTRIVVSNASPSAGTTTTATAAVLAAKSPAASNALSPSTSAGGKILVQSTGGKQIVVANSQYIKLSPKSSATVSSGAVGSSSNVTAAPGQLHAIQIPGKAGIQYVRVVSAPKKTIISEASTAAAAKLLNSTNLKNKADVVVRPNAAGGKFIVTSGPKVDGATSAAGTAILSPSKVQKTIVTVPTIRNISSQEKTLTTVVETPTGSAGKNIPMALTVLRPKSKILEINSEIKRMTTTPVSAAGADMAKRIVSGPDGKRYVVIQSQQPAKNLGPKPKVIVKSGTFVSDAAAGESAMKSFIICKNNPIQGQSGSIQNKETAVGSNVVQLKKPLTALQHQQLQQQQQQKQQLQILTAQSTLQQKPNLVDDKSSTSSSIASMANNNSNTNSAMSKFVPIKIKEELLDVDELNALNFSEDPLARGGVRRKHCNCSKSQCLKLYCDCFANGEFCQDCTCKDCFNSLQYEDERLRAIRSCLERNPSAFKPKITSAADQGDARAHNKGCNCKRSGCLKNYCECFEAKIPCSNNCKCVGCRNIEDRPDLDLDPIDPKILETIANASNATNNIARAVSHVNSGKRSYEHTSESETEGKRRRSSHDGEAVLTGGTQLSDDDDDSKLAAEKRSTNFITQEVIDATIQCMISQADECSKNNLPAHQIEKMVIEELGRCLVEIIDFSIRNTDSSFTQN